MIKYILVLIALIPYALYAEGPWELAKSKDGIVVKTRTVDGSGFKEFQGVTYLKASLESLVALLEDTSAYTTWMPNCLEAKVIKRSSAFDMYLYTVRKAPWPVKNRDMVVHTVTSHNKDKNSISIYMRGTEGMVPENPDYVRVKILKGMWRFTPVKDGLIEVVYQVHADLGGNVPEWLANSTSIDQPFKVLSNIRNLVSTEKYKNTPPEYLKKYAKK